MPLRLLWIPLAALVIALLLRAAKSPALGSLFARVPREHRPRVVLLVGALSGMLDAIARDTPLGEALVGGLVSAALAVLGHGVAGGLVPAPKKTVYQALSDELDAKGLELQAGAAPPLLVDLPEVPPAVVTPENTGTKAPDLDWGPKPSER